MNLRPTTWLAFVSAWAMVGAQAMDFSTPDKALASFNDAATRNNIDDLVATIDFVFDAKETITRDPGSPKPVTDEQVELLAKKLEAEYRTRVTNSGGTRVDRTKCHVVKSWPLQDGVVQLAQRCPTPGGGDLVVSMFVARNPHGWHVVLSQPH